MQNVIETTELAQKLQYYLYYKNLQKPFFQWDSSELSAVVSFSGAEAHTKTFPFLAWHQNSNSLICSTEATGLGYPVHREPHQ